MAGKGSAFEKRIEPSFKVYHEAGIARLAFMPVHSIVVGPARMLVHTKKAPFDVYGYLVSGARMIGCELKSSVRQRSLHIVRPDAHGSGLQFHQLDALAMLAEAGGISRIVWENEGEVGVIGNESILAAHKLYMTALASEKSHRDVKEGRKSIRWERFEHIDQEAVASGGACIDWLRWKNIEG